MKSGFVTAPSVHIYQHTKPLSILCCFSFFLHSQVRLVCSTGCFVHVHNVRAMVFVDLAVGILFVAGPWTRSELRPFQALFLCLGATWASSAILGWVSTQKLSVSLTRISALVTSCRWALLLGSLALLLRSSEDGVVVVEGSGNLATVLWQTCNQPKAQAIFRCANASKCVVLLGERLAGSQVRR